VAPLDPGSRLPSVALRDEKGRAAAFPEGDTLYGFFKTTCPASELAWPYLARIRSLAEGGDLAVVAVSQDDPETTARFYQRLGIAIPTLYDPDPWTASEALGLTAVPTFLLVGEDGALRDRYEGFGRSKMEEFAQRAVAQAGRAVASLFAPGEDAPAIKPG